MNESREVLKSIQPLRLVVNPFFFLTFYIRQTEFSKSKTGVVVGFCLLLVTLSYKICYIFKNPSRKFEEYVENYGSLAPVILCVLSYLGYLIKTHSIVKVLNFIVSCPLYTDKRYLKKIFWVMILQVVTSHAFPFSSSVWISYHYYMDTKDPWTFISSACFDYFMMMHFTATGLVFSNMIFFCQRLIRKTNKKLRQMNSTQNKMEYPLKKLFEKQGKISTIQVASANEFSVSLILDYDKICESCLDFNRHLGGPLAASCMNNLISLVLYTYYLTKYGIVELWMFAFISSYCFLQIWIILFACEGFKREVQNTGILVNRLILETQNQPRKELLQQFSQLLLHRKIKFTACGMFSLDYTLIYSALATIATYLAIAFQFEYSSRSNQRNASRQPPITYSNYSIKN